MDMLELSRQYGRYSYRRIAALLRDALWQVNDKRIERLWRRQGLPPTSPRGHRPDGPKAGHALTFKLDQSVGASQGTGVSMRLLVAVSGEADTGSNS